MCSKVLIYKLYRFTELQLILTGLVRQTRNKRFKPNYDRKCYSNDDMELCGIY